MAEKEEKKEVGGSKISKTEWGMVISFLFLIDGIQFGLDWVGIPWIATVGMLANRFISFVMGMAWPTYLYLRGVSMSGVRIISIIITFFFEEIPDVDALPLWGLDGLFVYLTIKAEEKIKEKTGIDIEKAVKTAEIAEGAIEGSEDGLKGAAIGGAKAYAKDEASDTAQETASGITDEAAGAVGLDGEEGATGEDEENPDADKEKDNKKKGEGEEEEIHDDENKKRFLEALRETGSVESALEKSGIDEPTYEKWRQNDNQFGNDVDRILRDAQTNADKQSRSGGGGGGSKNKGGRGGRGGMGGGGGGTSSGGSGGSSSGSRGGSGQAGTGGSRGGGRMGGATGNLLDLAGLGGGSGTSDKDATRTKSNLLDLSLSYGERKKRRENE